MSGIVFAVSSNYWILLVASVVGVISPSGNEIGPFRAVEESILAHLTAKEERSDIFAWYTLIGTAGAALGTITCGWMVQLLSVRDGWTNDSAYRVVFILYAALGVAKLLLVFCLSPAVELSPKDTEYREEPTEEDNLIPAGLTEPSSKPQTTTLQRIKSLFPTISPVSISILSRLLVLFTLDSFASGLASPSWLTYFFTTIHHLPPSTLGTLFLVSNLLATASNLAALPLARRLGPLKTMVFTHLPSAVFLALIPLPSAKWPAMALLALRACTQSMDQAPRQAFLAAAVLPEERTAVLGVVNVVKTLAQAGGIGTAGVLAGRRMWVVSLGGAGGMKAAYDLLMLWMFLGLKERGSHASGV
ncbi:major facilitator superfamily domain-containing protein [Cercophora scortea]|uniref:Major facilitator superfamily domain-containing protein n=1 Tax=Cercophora scortea TaxID=314031 RepID=A0AAE0IPM7_9PEZI|nr:major facilitator superfamily domain-containing protein [Cercophora scortea]